jgi:hypothetical protein
MNIPGVPQKEWISQVCRKKNEYARCAAKRMNIPGVSQKEWICQVCRKKNEYARCAAKRMNIPGVSQKELICQVCRKKNEYARYVAKRMNMPGVSQKEWICQVCRKKNEYARCAASNKRLRTTAVVWLILKQWIWRWRSSGLRHVSLVVVYRRFRGACCLHDQGPDLFDQIISLVSR